MPKPQKASSPLFSGKDVETPRKPKKPKIRKKSSYSLGQGYGGRTSFGRIVPPLLGRDQKPFACPCGRVQMMRNIQGGVFLFDTEGALGDSKIGLDYGGPVAKAIAYLNKAGCGIHLGRQSLSPRPDGPKPVPDNLR